MVCLIYKDVQDDLNEKIEDGTFTGEQGPVGPPGPIGNSGVYMGTDEPTDPDVSVWIDTSDGTVVATAEGASF